MKKKFFLSTVALLSLGVLAGCGGSGDTSVTPTPTSEPASEPASLEPIPEEALNVGTVKVWCAQEILDLTTNQLAEFKAAHPTWTIDFVIEPKSESSAAGDMIFDPDAGADLYFFAQDQLARLVTARAIAQIPNAYLPYVARDNAQGSMDAAKVGSTYYAYPATADNTFFMFYNKADLAGVNLNSFNDIVAKVTDLGKKVYFNYSSAWYNSAFFYGVGCHSDWTTEDGAFTAYDDNYNSVNGKIAVKAIHELFGNAAVAVDDGAGDAFSNNASVLVSGTWVTATVKDALGANYGVATLPDFTVDGVTYPMKTFGGFKLVGVKPQTIIDRTKGISQLAMYLTGEDCSLDRFDEKGWGPANLPAQNAPRVAEDETLRVCFAQMATATPQGQYPGDWWDHEGLIGKEAVKSSYNAETILANYEAGLDDLLS
jgi:arabinogalactan oligomer/maltooligosaccharide transport system substrate-binding protein